MAIKTAAKLRKKTAKARKRDARTAERQGRVKSKRRSSPTDHLFWVEQGDDLISRTVPFSRQLNAVPPERASERGRWVSRPHLRVGDVLLNRECRLVQIVSLPADLKDNPRVRPLPSSTAGAERQPPDFCWWVVEGDDLGTRSAVRRDLASPPPGGRPGRWVSGSDLRLNDIVIGAGGDRQKVVALSDDPGALPVLAPIADCDLFWIVSGPDLDSRPPCFDGPPPPASAESGRWISRRYLQVGDVLLLERGEFARVINLPERIDDDPRLLHLTRMYEFTARRPSMISCTPNHPFYVRDRGWTAAGDLQPGDLLLTPTGDWVPVNRVEDLGEIEPVYNLEVEDHHTYFVAGARGGPAVLVHNACAPALPNVAEADSDLITSPRFLQALAGLDANGQPYTDLQKAALAAAGEIVALESQQKFWDLGARTNPDPTQADQAQILADNLATQIAAKTASFNGSFSSVTLSAFQEVPGSSAYGPGQGLDHAKVIASFYLTPLSSQPALTESTRQSGLLRLTLASVAYDDGLGLPAGWSVTQKWNFANGGAQSVGFRATLFFNKTTNTYILAFKGTHGINVINNPVDQSDWISNFLQAGGWTAQQYEDAKDVVGQALVIAERNDGQLEVVGHSLGGGLATVAAIRAEVPATVFNPAGINQKTVEGFGNINNPPARIRAYAIEGDILTAGQDANNLISNWLPNTAGNKIVLRLKDPPTLGSAVDRHFREALFEAFGVPMPKRFPNRSGVLRAP